MSTKAIALFGALLVALYMTSVLATRHQAEVVEDRVVEHAEKAAKAEVKQQVERKVEAEVKSEVYEQLDERLVTPSTIRPVPSGVPDELLPVEPATSSTLPGPFDLTTTTTTPEVPTTSTSITIPEVPTTVTLPPLPLP